MALILGSKFTKHAGRSAPRKPSPSSLSTRSWLEDNPEWCPSFVSETKAPQEGLDGSCSTEGETKVVPHVWSGPATSIAQRSSEDAIARSKLGHYVHSEIPARDRKKSLCISPVDRRR